MEKLYAFGCSFTFGEYLPDNTVVKSRPSAPIHSMFKLKSKPELLSSQGPSVYAWPSLLAKQLDIPFENLGSAGASNIEIAAHILDTTFTPQDLVVIMWTFRNRHSILEKLALGNEHWRDRYWWQRHYANSPSALMRLLYNETNAEFANDIMQTAVHHYLTQSSCRYLACSLEPNELKLSWNPMEIFPCREENWKKDTAADGYHPGVKSQAYISKYLHKQLFK